jgi:hypothetical protein
MSVVEYECRTCGTVIQLIGDDLENYDALILNWHSKARQGDYFSRFVFEYLAFLAYLRGHLFFEEEGDRRTIQRLKGSKVIRNRYLKLVEKDKELEVAWKTLMKELKVRPLHNSSRDYDAPEMDRWWNVEGENLNENKVLKRGIVHGLTDWVNMVEFWYATRNNLFHGGKNPSVQRDAFLVEMAFRTLDAFMKDRISSDLTGSRIGFQNGVADE